MGGAFDAAGAAASEPASALPGSPIRPPHGSAARRLIAEKVTMDEDECRRRFADADHAYLATVGPDGAPHLVPVVHDLTADEIVVVVDHKPKRTQQLRRLANIRAHPEVAFLVDHWSTDWDRLWWVRADAVAEVVDDGPRRTEGVERLQHRYPQYRERVPTGPLIVARVRRWTGWSATHSA